MNYFKHLKFKTNYNVILWHFVDSLSEWNYYVADHIPNFFKENFEINNEDKMLIDAYKKERMLNHWDYEHFLYTWAYEGFQTDKYPAMLKLVKHLENKKDKNGTTLGEFLKSKVNLVEKVIQDAEKSLEEIDPNPKLDKLRQLFDIDEPIKNVDCYLTFSPDISVQGGANGECLMSEISFDENNNARQKYIVTLTHEFFHEILTIREQYEKIGGIYSQKLNLLKSYSMVSDMIDEICIHTVCNVFMFGNVPSKKLADYSDLSKGKNLYYKILWTNVEKAIPILGGYLSGVIDKKQTLDELDEIAKGILNDVEHFS